MKCNSLLIHLSFSPVIFLCATASAVDTQPACRSITNPSLGSVCYTEWPFSSRQRGEGGTKTWEQIVERVEPNYVIVDTQVIVQEQNGITSKPTPNIVSSSGNVSIVNQIDSSVRELEEVKNSLQAEASGCVPPVCGQVKNQLDTVNQKISQYSESKRVAIQAGGNEKILFKWTTKVECSRLGICGPGAWMNGVIRVNQRYLGNPSSIRQETLSLVNSSQPLISQTSSGSFVKLRNKNWNKCLNLQNGTQNGVKTNAWECVSHPDQEWKIEDASNGFVKLRNKNSGRCLNLQNGTQNGVTTNAWECVSHPDQEWKIEDAGNGFVKLRNKNWGRCLNLQSATQNGVTTNAWECVSHPDQEWKIENAG